MTALVVLVLVQENEMNLKLFEYCALHQPSEEARKNGAKTTIVLPPQHILAKSEQHAQTLVCRMIPKEYEDRIDEVELAIRPF